MIQTPIKLITLEEFLSQPETKPVQEYIDKQIYTKPMSQGQHSRLQLKLSNAINAVTEDNQIALAFPELRCTFAGKSIVPDVAVFLWDKLPVNEDGTIANKFNLAPDWIIEILSPEQYMGLITKKIVHCLDNGSLMGWLIDPQTKLIFTYTNDCHPKVFEDDKDLIPVPNFADKLQLTLGEIFRWLQVKVSLK
ncbi:Uma2 family endonuclease [Geminocystis sp. GBBB08]|uniref:Uma2 family endonuclease n=1 Tax=Geminocystis sp. GBBB08 TaxID=2604140 RepID=UPI0027E26F93|nr:Uma2 family endonuclease [Geminocystis sp. GBBB08]MBL1211373.1 Uma2 family endonuclease [Geminocystis sp. GBBB08]